MRGTSRDFDWYTFSKIDPYNPRIDAFEDLIRVSKLDADKLEGVPISHRKNLLIAFQNFSHLIKKKAE